MKSKPKETISEAALEAYVARVVERVLQGETIPAPAGPAHLIAEDEAAKLCLALARNDGAEPAPEAVFSAENARAPPRRGRGSEVPFPERIYETPKRCAAALGICLDTLYRLIRAGRLRSIKVGHRRLIEVASVLELTSISGADLPRWTPKSTKPAPVEAGETTL